MQAVSAATAQRNAEAATCARATIERLSSELQALRAAVSMKEALPCVLDTGADVQPSRGGWASIQSGQLTAEQGLLLKRNGGGETSGASQQQAAYMSAKQLVVREQLQSPPTTGARLLLLPQSDEDHAAQHFTKVPTLQQQRHHSQPSQHKACSAIGSVTHTSEQAPGLQPAPQTICSTTIAGPFAAGESLVHIARIPPHERDGELMVSGALLEAAAADHLALVDARETIVRLEDDLVHSESELADLNDAYSAIWEELQRQREVTAIATQECSDLQQQMQLQRMEDPTE
uniref:Uncharacterized protein n=1 Tax=Coccolithus braarudii TaxID=221442 RepID=A0A7S0L7P0_9EUKA